KNLSAAGAIATGPRGNCAAGRSAQKGAGVMVVQEFGQLLAQALVALAFVAEDDGSLEQIVLQPLGPLAPQVRGRGAQHPKEAIGVLAVAADTIRCVVHG